MPLEFNDIDITYAERILLKEGRTFDAERREFIRQLNTCDLQAVPGSGKTTVLLAKLLILERNLPLESDRGILVISHTNVALNEIKNKIGKYCPRLFTYPNFVGTIQSFVDQFLAMPYFTSRFKKRVIRIDNEIYAERMGNFINTSLPGIERELGKKAKYYLSYYGNASSYRFDWADNRPVLTDGYKGKPLNVKKPRVGTWTPEEIQGVKIWLIKYKQKVLTEGYLCFDDAYFLAERFLAMVPRIINVLRSRFGYIFVDEMQDMERHQYELLEKLFGPGHEVNCSYQRIGDKNQAIHGGNEIMDDFWVDRPQVLQLTGSHRLTPTIADIVERFALSPIPINGLAAIVGEGANSVKPRLYVYTQATIQQVLPAFCQTIADLRAQDIIPESAGNVFKAIAWTTGQEEGKIKLQAYFAGFSTEEHKLRIDYSCLDSYLTVWDRNRESLDAIKKNLINALLRILRMEGVRATDDRPFNQHRMLALLSLKGEAYARFKMKLYQWSIGIVRGNKEAMLNDMRAYIPEFLNLFASIVSSTRGFLDELHQGAAVPVAPVPVPTNIFSSHGIELEVGTVHSAKGQTHTATLYLESFYQQYGGGNYESERLSTLLRGLVPPAGNIHKYVKQSMKMVYVGFSRPTHLLGFAVHKARFDLHLHDINHGEWEIVEV